MNIIPDAVESAKFETIRTIRARLLTAVPADWVHSTSWHGLTIVVRIRGWRPVRVSLKPLGSHFGTDFLLGSDRNLYRHERSGGYISTSGGASSPSSDNYRYVSDRWLKDHLTPAQLTALLEIVSSQ